MRRVSVVGNAGSGKTRLAAALARAIGAPHLELDSIFHQQNWQPLETEQFRAKVAEFVAADLFRLDPNQSILAWAWTQHRRYADRYSAAERDPAYQHITFVRVPSRGAADRLVAEAAARQPTAPAP